jgi:hypothetical protein
MLQARVEGPRCAPDCPERSVRLVGSSGPDGGTFASGIGRRLLVESAPDIVATEAIGIEAPVDPVWPWLVLR